MSETDGTTTAENDSTAETATTKPGSLEELLADLDEDRRKVILEQVSKPRAEAKNLRERLKAAEPRLAEYDRLVAASKTDAERAQEARTAAEERAAKAMQRAARSEVKAALAGVVDNADEIVDDLNLARFIDDDGEIDQDAVAALRQKYASLGGRRAPRPDTSQASAANGRSKSDPASEFASFIRGQLAR